MFFQILFLLFLYSQPDLKTILPAKVVSVQDGDTITVEFSFRANIRLKDCWAPETRTKDEEEKKKGLESKEFLKSMLKPGDNVIIEVPYSPNMSNSLTLSRVLGYVYKDLDGDNKPENISKEMVKAGMAKENK